MMDWLPSLPALIVAIPMLAAVVLVLLPDFRLAARVNIGASALIFALSCGLPWNLGRGEYLLADHLSVQFVLLTSFIGLTTAWFSEDYVAVEFDAGRLDAPRLRLYHAMFQAFLGFLLLALLSNNLGLTWVSVEAATIAAVVVVGPAASARVPALRAQVPGRGLREARRGPRGLRRGCLRPRGVRRDEGRREGGGGEEGAREEAERDEEEAEGDARRRRRAAEVGQRVQHFVLFFFVPFPLRIPFFYHHCPWGGRKIYHLQLIETKYTPNKIF